MDSATVHAETETSAALKQIKADMAALGATVAHLGRLTVKSAAAAVLNSVLQQTGLVSLRETDWQAVLHSHSRMIKLRAAADAMDVTLEKFVITAIATTSTNSLVTEQLAAAEMVLAAYPHLAVALPNEAAIIQAALLQQTWWRAQVERGDESSIDEGSADGSMGSSGSGGVPAAVTSRGQEASESDEAPSDDTAEAPPTQPESLSQLLSDTGRLSSVAHEDLAGHLALGLEESSSEEEGDEDSASSSDSDGP